MSDRELIRVLSEALDAAKHALAVHHNPNCHGCAQVFEKIESALAKAKAALEAGGWMPIESAPKEGDILVYLACGYVTRGRYLSGKFFAADSFGPTGTKPKDPTPTHWQPLPDAPARDGGEG